jgi:glycosyltransferase involved in cell wall biosynthesis
MNGSRSRARASARIAIVTPWFGPDLRGGAERQSWQLAHELAARGHGVDVLTTCSANFNDDWARNTLRQGVERRGPLTIRRFRVQARDRRAFERVNAILMSLSAGDLRRGVDPIGAADARLFYENNINSPGLCAYLAAEGRSYSHVLFLPYLYGPTLAGLPLVAERAYLQPCLHDEPYAYLGRVEETVHAARGILFNGEGEYELALRLFGPGIAEKSTVVGQGVDVLRDAVQFAERIGSFVPAQEHYVLYLGRQDAAKNVPMLVSAFGEFRRRQPASKLRLVLAGERPVSYGDAAKGIIDLGPVNEGEKAALLARARALVQPSVNESFSRVVYESWNYGRPVIVHGDCVPTATAVARSGGGFAAGSTPDWTAALERVDFASREELDRLGRLGRTYAERASAWPAVIERYEAVFRADETRRSGNGDVRPSIAQVVPEDAGVGLRAYAAALGRALGERGTAVGGAIVHETGGDVRANAASDPPAIAIYHGASADAGAVGNIDFVAWPAASVAPSRAPFLPVCVDPRLWDRPADVPLIAALQDGKTNLLYVGPIDTAANLSELLIVFLNYLTIDREARLTIAGSDVDDDAYARLFDELRRLELVDRVLATRDLSLPQFLAIFRVADVFITLDEREGYGRELVQAMWFDVPVIAYRTETARALVANAGLLVNDKSDLLAIAALAHIVASDRELREKIVAAGRIERARFDRGRAVDAVLAALAARREPVEANEARPSWPS